MKEIRLSSIREILSVVVLIGMMSIPLVTVDRRV